MSLIRYSLLFSTQYFIDLYINRKRNKTFSINIHQQKRDRYSSSHLIRIGITLSLIIRCMRIFPEANRC